MCAKKKDTVLVDGKFVMQKYPGKGGWTYIKIPAFGENKKTWFAAQKVNVIIDGHQYDNTSIWKTKDGNYFLPVKAAIRKTIAKEEGEVVHITLSKTPEVLESDEEIIICLKEDPAALKKWNKLPAEEKKRLTGWIINAPSEDLKVNRMASLMNELVSGKKVLNI